MLAQLQKVPGHGQSKTHQTLKQLEMFQKKVFWKIKLQFKKLNGKLHNIQEIARNEILGFTAFTYIHSGGSGSHLMGAVFWHLMAPSGVKKTWLTPHVRLHLEIQCFYHMFTIPDHGGSIQEFYHNTGPTAREAPFRNSTTIL